MKIPFFVQEFTDEMEDAAIDALRNESLQLGVRDGISNEVVQNPVEIVVNQGSLLVFVHRNSDKDVVGWEPQIF